MLFYPQNIRVLAFLLLCFLSHTDGNAQKASKSAILPVNPTPYDSLPSTLDSVEQVLVAQKANFQSLRQQSTSFYDSIRQVLTNRTAKVDSLPILDSNKQLLVKAEEHLESIKQRTAAVGDSAKQKIVQGISRLDSLPIRKDVRHYIMPKGLPEKVSSVPVELPPLATDLPSMPRIDDASRSLPQLPAKELPSEVTNHSLVRKAEKGLGKQKGIADSLTSVKSKFTEDQRLKQVKDSWNQIKADSLRDLSAVRDTLVSTGLETGEAWATEQAAKQLEGQLPKPLMAEHPQQDAMRSRLTEEALTFFEGNQDQLTQAKKQLTKLKRTYRQVKEQDSVFIKNTSFEGVPTRERLVYGINLNPSQTGLSSWQLRPQLGYQLNKVWTLGLGGQFQAGFTTEPIQVDALWKGGYGFVQREVARQFLLYGELAQERESVSGENLGGLAMSWQGWVGIGKQVVISDKLALQLLFLWDGLADRSVPVRDQFQMRLGIIRVSTK